MKIGWCFVAVESKVGRKKGANPKPGQRSVNTKMPKGFRFDGNVQAMGFRFKTDRLAVRTGQLLHPHEEKEKMCAAVAGRDRAGRLATA